MRGFINLGLLEHYFSGVRKMLLAMGKKQEAMEVMKDAGDMRKSISQD